MKTILKKTIFILGILTLSSAIFIGGSMYGVSQNFTNGLLNNLSMKNALVEGSILFSHIEKIDYGNIENAKQSMNIFLDSQIILIDQLITDSPNEKFKKRANAFLARIAKHRKENPIFEQNIKATQGEVDTNNIVQEILDKRLE